MGSRHRLSGLWVMPLLLSAAAGCTQQANGADIAAQNTPTEPQPAFDWGQGQSESVARAFGVVLPAAAAATIYELVGLSPFPTQDKQEP